MIITEKGTVKGLPYTAMKKQGGVWLHILVCKMTTRLSDEALTDLFNTSWVTDDEAGVKWNHTEFMGIEKYGSEKYVWLTYAAQTAVVDQYEEALKILGVQTEGGDGA